MIRNFHRAVLLCSSGLALFLVLACNASFTVLNPTPTPVLPTLEPALPTPTSVADSMPTISQQVALTTVPFSETNPGENFPAYTITTETPQLTGSDDPRVLAFNQRLNDLIASEVEMWRKNFQQLPITSIPYDSSLEITYTLISQIGDLWSFKFDIWFYANAAAHPGLNSMTMNYDLAQGRELALGDLFLLNSNYLETIAAYCKTELSKQPFFDPVNATGAEPTVENYRNWNITPDGLQVTFDTYQVAPGAAGPQMVTVPWGELSSLIDPQGPLAAFVP